MYIVVSWEDIVYGDYEGETKICDTWDKAVEYMVKSNKKKYEIEVRE